MLHLDAASQGTLRRLPSSIQNLILSMRGNGPRNESVTNTIKNVPIGDSFVFNAEGVIGNKFGDKNSLPTAVRMSKLKKAARKPNSSLLTTMETFNATKRKENVLLEDGTIGFKQMRVLSTGFNSMGSASVQLTPDQEQWVVWFRMLMDWGVHKLWIDYVTFYIVHSPTWFS